MAVVDAHQHFWWVARRTHDWPGGLPARLDRDFTPDDLAPELRQAGVDGTVLVQSLNDLDETQEYLGLERAHDFIRGVVGWAPLDQPGRFVQTLDRLRQSGKLVGIRHLISFEPDPDWLKQPAVLESLRAMARDDLAFDAVPLNFRQLETVFEVAGAIPDLRIVLNHLARPPVPDQGWQPWADIIARAAGYPNLAIKLSAGLDLVAQWQWSTPMLQRYADHVIDRFGPDRVMAASNWPVVLLGGSYGDVWHGITDLVADLSAGEREAVLGGTAERIYRLR